MDANVQTSQAQCCSGLEPFLRPELFKALGDPTRVGLLVHLAQCREPCTVGALAAVSHVDVSVVSRHLAMLRNAGILESERRGKEVLYTVRYRHLVATLRELADAIDACCPEDSCHGC